MMKFILSAFCLLSSFATFAQKDAYLLIGTYTEGKSEGIYVYKFNTENAGNSFISSTWTSNPSFLAVSPDKKFVYAVNEDAGGKFKDGGGITAFSFDKKKGSLTEINSRFSGGKHPCYIAVDLTGKWLFAGNYSSGTVGLFSINKNGSVDSVKQLIQHTGSGPDTARQQSPHVHSTNLTANQQYLFVADLGIDKIMTYRFNNKTGTLTEAPIPFVQSAPGAGPRHMAFDAANKFAYLLEEMTGTVVVYQLQDGALKQRQRTSALPADFKGFISGADIHISPDGNFLYCSNRGESNSISIFSINKDNGEIKLIGNQSTLGKTPRNFNFDPSGNFLLVANQQSDEIVIFKIDKQSGQLTATGKSIHVPAPVCIKWIY